MLQIVTCTNSCNLKGLNIYSTISRAITSRATRAIKSTAICFLQEQRAILENETLRRQVAELRCLFPQTDRAVPSYLEYYPVEKEKSFVNHGVTSPDLVSNFAFENGDSDITLHLELPSDVYGKRKAPEREAHSNDSGSQLAL
ncbi:PREDICTED: agamous-like MADS-box protein AGL15 [Prunus mume]|uniref:Agamous-like MADS-box protein AGL15 n=1 Tax=Prunus mume TaxID=102107 RepID=A0ABM0PX72_PRUMU|nr:PREDICTED: agamous-like MADS-box protein AGL15 [Prunus mume]